MTKETHGTFSKKEGVSVRPWLGIVGLSITQEIARYYNLPVDQGVLVTNVAEGSPAEDAGLADNDIILRMDGAPLYSIENLSGEIHNRKIGDRVKITVHRRGREQAFEVTLSRMP